MHPKSFSLHHLSDQKHQQLLLKMPPGSIDGDFTVIRIPMDPMKDMCASRRHLESGPPHPASTWGLTVEIDHEHLLLDPPDLLQVQPQELLVLA